MLNWLPDRCSSVSLHIQIKEYIKSCVKRGTLRLGEKLPTQSEMAKAFEVNRSTVIAALEELKAEGIIISKTKRGTYISPEAWHALLDNPYFDWACYSGAGCYEQVSSYSKDIFESEKKKDFIRLHAGELSSHIIDSKMVSNLTSRLPNLITSLSYCDPKGLFKLRLEISKHYQRQGMNVSPEDILIVNGISQGFLLLSLGIINAGTTVLIDKPSYLNSVKILQSAGVKTYGIPLTSRGLNLIKIKEAKRHSSARLLFTNPFFHNPTSVCTTSSHAKKLLEICFDLELPVIEDDTYRELNYEGETPKPLIFYDDHNAVIHLASLSKQLFSGLRLGWIIANKPIIDRLTDIKSQISISSSIYDQTAAFELFRSGLYDTYLEIVKAKLKNNRDITLRLLDLFFDDIATWSTPKGGFYVWLTILPKISLKKLFDRCLSEKVIVAPGTLYHQSASQQIRLSFSYADEAELKRGLWVLSQAIREQMENK